MLIGLNASSDVIFIARGLMEHPELSESITINLMFIVILVGMVIFLTIIVILEINYGWQSIKTPPRRVTAENVMENDIRREIVRLIREHPRITFSSIKRHVVRSPRTVLEHLGILQRFNVVRSRDIRHNTAFFDASLTDKEWYFQYFLAKDKFFTIL